jgi:hypothetical protein
LNAASSAAKGLPGADFKVAEMSPPCAMMGSAAAGPEEEESGNLFGTIARLTGAASLACWTNPSLARWTDRAEVEAADELLRLLLLPRLEEELRRGFPPL